MRAAESCGGRNAPQPTIVIVPWADPAIEASGYFYSSLYVELFWTPRVGPTGVLLLRNLERKLNVWPHGFSADTAQLAGQLGVKPATVQSAFRRLETNGFAKADGDALALHRRAHRLPSRFVSDLPPMLVDAHHRIAAGALSL